jgi:hypothetical protein
MDIGIRFRTRISYVMANVYPNSSVYVWFDYCTWYYRIPESDYAVIPLECGVSKNRKTRFSTYFAILPIVFKSGMMSKSPPPNLCTTYSVVLYESSGFSGFLPLYRSTVLVVRRKNEKPFPL